MIVRAQLADRRECPPREIEDLPALIPRLEGIAAAAYDGVLLETLAIFIEE